MARENPAAQTAFGPMVITAVEQYEPPERRLVNDDLAARFLPPGQRALVGAMRWAPLRRLMISALERSGPGLWANLTCRKRFVDDKLDEALGSVDAVVILGAGMDTRPYRLARRSGILIFEVDLPVNIARKQEVVRRVLGGPPASVHFVPVDFEVDDVSAALARNGYRNDLRTFFVWEAVTQYLTADAVRGTFAFLREAASGSRLVFTYVRQDFIDGVNLYGAQSLYRRFRKRRQVWRFGMRPEGVDSFVGEYGWRVIEQAGPEYLVRHYVQPARRDLTASQIEWSVYAEKS